MSSVAVISVVTSGVVGVIAAIVPPLTRRSDRKHERDIKIEEKRFLRREHYWSEREKLYLELLRFHGAMMSVMHHIEGDVEGEPRELKEGIDAARLAAYGSDDIRQLSEALYRSFMVWIGVWPADPGDEQNLEGNWYGFAQWAYGLLVETIRNELMSGMLVLGHPKLPSVFEEFSATKGC
ncbi:hypothetical protein [Actinoallomurus soli]|uniref:hypothetical protein n=1 Tax=Actinoallomurus soli TaxID=2952535 RepID=UPI002092A69B|nr:hypothetical protein [Actinoallomurus soli]MCO5972891.1 hypothetical protein [Actinoallomurus soli]